MLLFIC